MKRDKLDDKLNTVVLETMAEFEELPDDIATLKQLLVEVISYNKIILDKLNKFAG